MVLTVDTSDTARLIALRLHWVAAVLLALQLSTAACQTTAPTLPAPVNPTQPGDRPDRRQAPTTLPGRTHCSWGRS